MSSALYILGRWAFRARVRVLAVWLGSLIVLLGATAMLSVGTDNTYTIPGTESQEALDALARTFPQVSGTSAQLIAVAPDGTSVRDDDFQAAVQDAATAIARIPQVSSATSPYDSDSSAGISADDSAALIPIQLSVTTTAVLPTTSAALQDAGTTLQKNLPDGARVAVGGQLFSQDPAGISVTELLGIAIAFIVLMVTFASAVAAGIPLITALLGVGVSLAVVLAATRFVTITSTTPLLALMLGLAVGIDYALFIIARHQEQVKTGIDPEESAARAIATSGSAVVFAATTVIIALLGLAVAGIPFLTTMGVAAAWAVATAVAIALTLTPALLGFAGWRVVGRRHRPPPHSPAPGPAREEGADPAIGEVRTGDFADEAAADEAAADVVDADVPDTDEPDADPPGRVRRGFFAGWVRVVTRWPLVTVILIVGALGAAAVPAAHLRLALPDAGSLEEGTPGRVTYDLIAEHFGPGFNGPLIVTGSVIQSTDPVGLMDDLGGEIAALPGVASVPLSTPNESGDTGIVQVIPDGAPDSEATTRLVGLLRGQHDHFQTEYGVDLSVTGYTAAGIDISDRLAGALLPFGLLVAGLSLVLLAMVFRSVVVPVTAALGYALSIAAAFGLASLVFVDGFLADALNVADVGSVISFMPIILMGVLFGLAMDYEVFLVSRMREEYVHGDGATDAVHHGFAASARVVTAAATIMFAVFAAFIPEGDASIQPIAFGLAVGVLIDAFIVRMALIPAVLVLFGDGAWWMPRWLDRALPHFDVEGADLSEELALAHWPALDDLAIATEGARTARAANAGGLDTMVPAGDALLIQSPDSAARTELLLALTGRAAFDSGRVKVLGLVLPARAGAIRAASAYVRLGHGERADIEALGDALTGEPALLAIDAADDVADPQARARLRAMLTDAHRRGGRIGAPLTIVAAARDGADESVLPADVPVHLHAADRRMPAAVG